ncbi:MAG: hypothetical protein U0936_16460 [Planctomycetaceae bacterium]
MNPNDTGDGDTGANALQNFPVISSAVSGPLGTTISGTLNSVANTNYRLEFFSIPSGIQDTTNGEGPVYLGYLNVTTDSSGNASFVDQLNNITVAVGDRVTATATVIQNAIAFGNTSEFSANVTVTSGGSSGTSGNNFQIGTSSSEAVAGLGGNDLITSGSNIAADGQFLSATVSPPFTNFTSGQTMGGWAVTQGSVEVLTSSFIPSYAWEADPSIWTDSRRGRFHRR